MSGAGRGRPPRLLGFLPAGNPYRRLLAASAATTALGFASLRYSARSSRRPPELRCSFGPATPASRFRDPSAHGLLANHSGIRRAHAPAALRRTFADTNCRKFYGRDGTVNALSMCRRPRPCGLRSPRRISPTRASGPFRRPYSVFMGLLPSRSRRENGYKRGLRPRLPPRPPRDLLPV
jgi:hypothetical protein